ncbi:hypothetical protein M6B38_153530 [Iris pallida]|uniref:Uncharacterized protein n=1 Tax=Iris pallida TaxID=29817 RepID=A0AAX6F5H5_IRIPA|nr:hypothetical protein M6B38_153530 [Iris pallida]
MFLDGSAMQMSSSDVRSSSARTPPIGNGQFILFLRRRSFSPATVSPQVSLLDAEARLTSRTICRNATENSRAYRYE